MKPQLIALLTTLLLLGLWPAPATQAQAGITLEVQPGFDSFFKSEHWGVVRVTVANQGPDVQAAVQVRYENYGNDTALYRTPVDLPGQSRKQITLYLPPLFEQRLTIDLVDAQDRSLASERVNIDILPAVDFLVGVVASDGSLLNGLAGLNTPNGDRVAVAHLTVEALPEMLQPWSALDMLVINDVDTSTLTPAQQDALSYWVHRGGRLVIGGGPNTAQTLAGLTPLLPFEAVETETLPHPLTGLQTYLRTQLDDRGPYIAALPTATTGHILVSEENKPLIISSEVGRGQVHYLALDLSLAPLDTVADEGRFLPRLVDRFEPYINPVVDRINGTQMQTSLALIPNQTLPTPGIIALFLCIYVLAIGPANYLILGRLKRRELSWLTLPLIILVFCGIGYVGGFRLRGGQPLLRQIAIVQADAGASVASVDSFIGIYSPQRTRYRLEIDGTALARPLSSSGLTGDVRVISGDSTQVDEIQADIGGMPTLVSRSQTAPPQIQADIRYNSGSHTLAGVILNATDRPISDAHLLINDRLLRLGTLPPGETAVDGVTRTHSYGSFYDTSHLTPNTAEALTVASRDLAMQALFGYNNYYYPPNNTAQTFEGLYLTGWQEGSPVTMSLTGRSSDAMSETLLLVSLPLGE